MRVSTVYCKGEGFVVSWVGGLANFIPRAPGRMS